MRFALNQAALAPYARFLLHGVAAELTTAYPEAAFSILGFADPLGTRARNAVLSAERAKAVKAFLVDQGVAAARTSAVGCGTDFPGAPSQADGARALGRRPVTIIEPVM